MASKVKATIQVDDQASKTLKDIKALMKSLGETAKSIQGLQMLEMLAEVGSKISGYFGQAYQAFAEAEQEAAKLNATLELSGQGYQFSTEQLLEFTDGLEKTKLVSQELINSATSVALAIGTIKGDNLEDLITVATDMSKVLGKDLTSIVQGISKAFADDGNLESLSKMGLYLDDATVKYLELLKEQGRGTEAQAILIEELNSKYLGVADTMGNTVSGAVEKSKIAWGDFAENVGLALSPVIKIGAELSKLAAETLGKMPAGLLAGGTAIAGMVATVGTLGVAFTALKPIIIAITGTFKGMAIAMGPIGLVGVAIAGVVAIGTAVAGAMAEAERKQQESLDRARNALKEFRAKLTGDAEENLQSMLYVQRNHTNNVNRLNDQILAKTRQMQGLSGTDHQGRRTLENEIGLLRQQKEQQLTILNQTGQEITLLTNQIAREKELAQAEQSRADAQARGDAQAQAEATRQAQIAKDRAWLEAAKARYDQTSEEDKILKDIAELETYRASADRDAAIAGAMARLKEIADQKELLRLEIERKELQAKIDSEVGDSRADLKAFVDGLDPTVLQKSLLPTEDTSAWDKLKENILGVGNQWEELGSKIGQIFTLLFDQQTKIEEQAIKNSEKENTRIYKNLESEIASLKEKGESTYELEKELNERKAIDEEAIAKRKNDLGKKKFDSDKFNNIANITMETAKGVMTTWANPILAAFIAGLGAVQAGVVASQAYVPAFATGGMVYPTGSSQGTLIRAGEYETEYILRQSQLDKIKGDSGTAYIENYYINVSGVVGDAETVAIKIDTELKSLRAKGKIK